MIKPCSACNNEPIKNNIYKTRLEHFLEVQLPKDNKHYENKNRIQIKLKNIEPNRCIFYFASQPRDFTKKLQIQVTAYGKLKNSGVTKTNKNGDATLYLDCPQIYIAASEKVYSRHFHFIYWDEINKTWEHNVYTQQILCNVKLDFVKKHMKKIVLIDARNYDSYMEDHIKGAISMPFDQKWTSKSVFKEINTVKKDCKDKLVPIVVYCAKGCNSAIQLYDKLNKLEFYNTMHLEF